jgi:ABC-type cobalt transport system substrate-binding protein
MRILLLVGKWLLVTIAVVVWIAVVPLVDLVAGRFGGSDEADAPPGARAQRAQPSARAA